MKCKQAFKLPNLQLILIMSTFVKSHKNVLVRWEIWPKLHLWDKVKFYWNKNTNHIFEATRDLRFTEPLEHTIAMTLADKNLHSKQWFTCRHNHCSYLRYADNTITHRTMWSQYYTPFFISEWVFHYVCILHHTAHHKLTASVEIHAYMNGVNKANESYSFKDFSFHELRYFPVCIMLVKQDNKLFYTHQTLWLFYTHYHSTSINMY